MKRHLGPPWPSGEALREELMRGLKRPRPSVSGLIASRSHFGRTEADSLWE